MHLNKTEFFDTDKGCSWNEFSGRYAEFQPEFYIPKRARANSIQNKQASVELEELEHAMMDIEFKRVIQEALQSYKGMLNMGIAKEIARMVLPQNVYTQAYWTVSLQGVVHFLEQRLKQDAQYEIRKYAQAVYRIVKKDLDKIGITFEQ